MSVTLVAAAVAIATLSARTGSLDERARAIEAQLRCPTCQGLSIADSPATSATQMRALVREQLAGGATDDTVRAFFVARYGRWILLDPPLGGLDIALWLAPVVIVGIGALVVVRRARGREPARGGRLWRAIPSGTASRSSMILVAAGMALALGVPIVAAVGPRLAGQQVSGAGVSAPSPTIEQLEAFVRAEPRDVEALVALADALHAANRTAEAADRYKAALELDPTDVDALLGVGAILLEAGRPDAAGPVFDRVLALSADQPDALLYRALARLQVAGGVTDQVRADVARFLQVAPADDPRRAMVTGLLEGPAGSSGVTVVPPATGTPRP